MFIRKHIHIHIPKANSKPNLRNQSRRWMSTPPPESYAHLKTALPARKLPILYDDLTPRNTHNLNITLASYIPPSWLPHQPSNPNDLPLPSANHTLPLSHHLVYFNTVLPASLLLPDGTDPQQSPGEPFVRRMWAGGYVKVHPERKIKVDGGRYCCVEGIRDVSIKGLPGDEKVFVGIERRVGVCANGEREQEEDLRGRMWAGEEGEWADAVLIERRNIVFMRDHAKVDLTGARNAKEKILRAPNPPTFTHTLLPTPSLLFRYSALTFNAHAIHLDPTYTLTQENHRNLLVHGPLSFTLLTLLLQNHISSTSIPTSTSTSSPSPTLSQPAKNEGEKYIEYIEYRNLAPLYAGEVLKLCGRESERGEGRFDVWAETPEGGIAVKGTARVGRR